MSKKNAVVESAGVVDGSFVAQEFYLEPPDRTASAEEWREWSRKDESKRRAAKVRFNKSQPHAPPPEEFSGVGARKVNGVYRQGPLTGWQGSAEDQSLTIEAGVEAQQEYHIALVDMEKTRSRRAGTRKGKSARRRANTRKARG